MRQFDFEVNEEEFEGFFLFLIAENRRILAFRLAKRLSDVDRLRSLHGVVKKIYGLKDEEIFKAKENKSFIYFENEKLFTSNLKNKKSLESVTSTGASSELTKTFFNFLTTEKVAKWNNKTYTDKLNQKETNSSTNLTIRELFNGGRTSLTDEIEKEGELEDFLTGNSNVKEKDAILLKKHSVYYYHYGEETVFDADAIYIPNKEEFLAMYRNINKRKTWVRILFLLAYIYGVRLTYDEMLSFTKEELENYLKENENPSSFKTFGDLFKDKNFCYKEELIKVSNFHFFREKILISKNQKILSSRSVEQQILQEFPEPLPGFPRQSLVFLRYHPIVHHMLIFDDIKLTAETYNLSAPNLYRIQKLVRFEFDRETFPEEATMIIMEVENIDRNIN